MGTLYDCLLEVNLEKYYETFLNHGISKAESLLKLTPRDYGILGVNTTEERRRLYELINLLRSVLNPSSHVASGSSYQRNARKRIHSPGESVKKEFPSTPHTPPPTQKDAGSPSSPVLPYSATLSSVDTIHSRNNPETMTSGSYADSSRSSPQNILFIEKGKYQAGYNYGIPKMKKKGRAGSVRDMRDEKIKVCVRKRPLCRRNTMDVVEVHNGHTVIVNERKQTLDLTSYILQHKFYFDDAFGEDYSNEEVYVHAAKPLVEWVFEKGQATIFAYGQTGAGKTFTMMGSGDTPGLYLLAAEDIFSIIESERYGSGFHVWLSYYEIYCGQLFDLLNGKKRLHAREDSSHKVCISGLTETQVSDVSSLMQVLDIGNASRSKGSTGANPDSSRSHAILQLQVRDSMDEYVGRISFIDLAGNERASDVKDSDRQSRKEGAEINQSLLALKECIRSLDQESSFTPFRQSKLTHILKDSFTGKSKTCMIANISPNQDATECTLNTLRYANRVKEIHPDTGSPRVMRRKPTDNISANKNTSGAGVSPSFFHHSNLLCTSTPIRRQCSDYNVSPDTGANTVLDPNESPIQGHRMPRKVSNRFNILPDKITVSKCIPVSENLPVTRQNDDGLSLEAEFDNYQSESCLDIKMDNIHFPRDTHGEPLTSDFNYDLNDLNKIKKEDAELAREARLIQCEGGDRISPSRISSVDIKMPYGNSLPSDEHLAGQRSHATETRVRNHSDPGIMPSALADARDDCKIKRRLSSDVMSSHYDRSEEHSNNSIDSDHPIGSPKDMFRLPSSPASLQNHQAVDTELKTVFPLPPSPPCIKSTPNKREQMMHMRDIWDKRFTVVTEPHVNVSHVELSSPNSVLAKRLSPTLSNKGHQPIIPEEKKHFRKISRDYNRKDETSAGVNNRVNSTPSSTVLSDFNSAEPTAGANSQSQDQPMGGIYANKLTVAEELLSSLKDSAQAISRNQDNLSVREASSSGIDSKQPCHEIEHGSSPNRRHQHYSDSIHLQNITNSRREEKENKETNIPQVGACPRSPESLPDLCANDIAVMKENLLQFLHKMSSISTKVHTNTNSNSSSQESSLEGAIYPPTDNFEVDPFFYSPKYSNADRTTNPEGISNHSPSTASPKETTFQENNASEPINLIPVNAWSPSSPKIGFFPIDPQPVHNVPSPTLSKSPVPRHVVYPVPFLSSEMSVSENHQEILNSKEVCERVILAHEKQLATMTMLCKQEMKLLLLAKSGQKSFADFIEKISYILSCKLKAISLLQQEIHGASVISAAGGQKEGAVFCGGSRDPSK